MSESLNLKIANFNQQINSLINSSDLDAGIIYYIIKNVYNEVEKQYYKIINQEQYINHSLKESEKKED